MCRGVGIYADDANITIEGITEHDVMLTKLNADVGAKHLILSAVTGDFPGTVIKNKPFDETTKKIGIMLFSPSSIKATFDWMVIDPFNFRNKWFQYNTVKVEFETFDKCTNIQFTEELEAIPAIALSLYASHKLDPFFFDYSLVWATDVKTTGFTACVHEAVLFSGGHIAYISYVAISSTKDQYGALTENHKMTFEPEVLKDYSSYFNDDNNMYQFCKKYPFENRYLTVPPVFVTSEVDTAEPSAGEQTTWIRKVTQNFAYICTKNSEDEDLKRNFQANVSIIIAGPKPFHPCMGKAKPTNLECYAGCDPDLHPSQCEDTYFGCFKTENCEDAPLTWVCSSDFGTYKSDCHMKAETCEMYGKTMVQNVTYTDGKCPEANGLPSDPPFQTGQDEVTQAVAGVAGLSCKVITLNHTLFHDYSDILIQTTVSFPKKQNHGLFQAGVASWTEDVKKTSFKACVKVTGGAYDTAVYGNPHVEWVAYQKNVHRRINNLGLNPSFEGGSIKVPNFRRGVSCEDLEIFPEELQKLKMKMDNDTRVMVSIHHTLTGQYFTAGNAWMRTDDSVVTGNKFRLCIKGTEVFSAPMNELRLDWVAFDQSVATAAGDSRVMTIPDTRFSNSQPNITM
jgi:hypothetical protein